ncbi:hypothetical protein SODALDRAFT_332962 [Sodiomyces alkalinus F11]|uniref:LrgB-domain-containing protein n=1 Tax=Sodiomyces alkalinus (strain CBS 110278 / VKM F-3762 / F11) TaxID=1314773 RepID=A0A3N2PV62_SODAK|nr:hypothetical protein SODALDRAFT_332962 [Sodiomyces alkalinus F11]ROT38392.1 hypothetical protein SODALDRAFT_332962 [Sodiomyces alkalinus F11]
MMRAAATAAPYFGNDTGNDTGNIPAERTAPSFPDALRDAATAFKLFFIATAPKLLTAWLYVPFGIAFILAFSFAVHTALDSTGILFPASVACLILLFLALLLSERLLGGHRTRAIVNLIDVPAGWSLRWINLFFTPSFILLPLSPSIGIAEVSKIIGVFLVGFVVMMAAAAYVTRGLQLLLGTSKRAAIERAEEMRNDADGIPLADSLPRENYPNSDRDGDRSQPSSTPQSPSISASPSAVSLNGLVPPPPSQTPSHLFQDASLGPRGSHPNETSALTLNLNSNPTAFVQPSLPLQYPPPAPRAQIWAARLTRYPNAVIYTLLFLFAGLPVYFSTGYAMPAHLTFTILCYLAALAVPPNWRQYLHPVLVTALLAFLGLWALAAIRTGIVSDGKTSAASLHEALSPYRTGATYQALWRPSHHATGPNRPLPGAGDLFATVLDAAIVALALPMYQYRRELRTHFLAIVAPSVAFSVASLFGYPALCAAVGIEARRSLAFAARSLTLALAIPATENLGGDRNTVAAVAIMSGILGALVGERMLRWLRIPEDDYVTRGVTLGANSSAIATAVLLRTDPRAAALSSLSMSLFGTITVLFTSIPPLVHVVRSLVGL